MEVITSPSNSKVKYWSSLLQKKYREAVLKAATATDKEAQRILDRELAKLQTDYDKCIAETDQHSSRVEMEGIKTHSELVSQKMQLEQELQQINNARENFKDPNKGGKL